MGETRWTIHRAFKLGVLFGYENRVRGEAFYDLGLHQITQGLMNITTDRYVFIRDLAMETIGGYDLCNRLLHRLQVTPRIWLA